MQHLSQVRLSTSHVINKVIGGVQNFVLLGWGFFLGIAVLVGYKVIRLIWFASSFLSVLV